jgi:hypothetical protein
MNKETKYLTNLQWMQRPSEFDRDHHAVMLACSRKAFVWTSWTQMKRQAGLAPNYLKVVLKELHNYCIIAHSKNENGMPYFALYERLPNI